MPLFVVCVVDAFRVARHGVLYFHCAVCGCLKHASIIFHKSHRQESCSLVQDFCPYHSPCLKSLCKGLKCVAWQTTARFRIATKAHKRPKALQAYYIGDRISFATILGQSGTAAVFCSKKQRLAVMEFSEDEVLSRPWTCYELTTPTCFIYSLYSYHLYISLWYTYIPLNSIGPEPHKPGPYDAKKISCFLDRSVPTDWIRLGGSRHRSCNFIVVKLWNPFPWLFWNFFLLDVAKKWHKSHKPSGRLNEPKTQGHYNKLLLRVSESVHDLASQQQLRFATIRPVAVVACIQNLCNKSKRLVTCPCRSLWSILPWTGQRLVRVAVLR